MYKLTPNLTINAGLRYSFFNVFHETQDRRHPVRFRHLRRLLPQDQRVFSYPRHADFDPRLGIAWAHGRTVLRAGAGIYHSDGQEDDQNLPISNDVLPLYAIVRGTSPGLLLSHRSVSKRRSRQIRHGHAARSLPASQGHVRGFLDRVGAAGPCPPASSPPPRTWETKAPTS